MLFEIIRYCVNEFLAHTAPAPPAGAVRSSGFLVIHEIEP
jgi:hypothetical protein